jgi:hypothetical protein
LSSGSNASGVAHLYAASLKADANGDAAAFFLTVSNNIHKEKYEVPLALKYLLAMLSNAFVFRSKIRFGPRVGHQSLRQLPATEFVAFCK